MPQPLPLWSGRSPMLRAALLTLASAVLFSFMFAFIRIATNGSTWMGPGMPVAEVVFFRNLFALVLLLPWLSGRNAIDFRTPRLRLYGVRGLCEVVGMLCWFSAIALMPMAEVVALGFTGPMFVTIGAALLLGEVVRLRRWTAVAVAALGAVIILQPWSLATLNPWSGLVLVSSLFGSLALLSVKVLARTEPPGAMVAWMSIVVTPASLLPALIVWELPSLAQLGVVVLVAALGTLAHVCVSQALALADASALTPFKYFNLPVTAAIGWIFFDQSVEAHVWLGATVIAASSIYIAHREAVVARVRTSARAASVPAPMIEASTPAAAAERGGRPE